MSFSVSKRINLGFAFITSIVMLGSGLAYFAVDALGDTYKNYRATAKQTIVINNFVEDLFQARIAALKYRAEPNEANKQEVRSNIAEIIRDAENYAADQNDPQTLASLAELTDLGRQYESDFLRMSDAITTAAAANNELLEIGRQTRVQLTELGDLAVENNAVQLLSLQADAQENLLLGRFYLEEFFMAEDAAIFQQAIGFLDTSERLLQDAKRNLEAGGTFGWETSASEIIDTALTGLAEVDVAAEQMRASVTDFARLRDGSLDQIGPVMQDSLERWAEAVVEVQDTLGPQGAALVTTMRTTTPVIALLAILLTTGVAVGVGRWITMPIRRLADTTCQLSEGNIDVKITGDDADHELGQMAKALKVFRAAHIDRDRVIREKEEKARAEQMDAVSSLSAALEDLAAGRLDVRVKDALSAEYDELRQNFNSAVGQLEQTLGGVVETSQSIEQSAEAVTRSSLDLSRRTENQAATLEQTAAALDQLTASVKSSADRTTEVAATVVETRSEAQESGQVVGSAVEAMGRIEESSQKISQITEVISDISFQTNLLALNAGVEAARAGEAGRGFAVVASEVRALAQRSSQAAREVSELIANSSSEVTVGTKLVNDAGQSLQAVIEKVDHISTLVAEIASSAAEQATGISEINIGVNQLDQVTQQNAGMVEASHQQAENMAGQSRALDGLVSGFVLSGGRSARRSQPPAPSGEVVELTPTAISVPPADQKFMSTRAAVGDDNTWADF